MRPWLALALQSRRDATRDPVELRRRDRAIAASVDRGATRSARVRAWLDAVLDGEDRRLLERIDTGLRGLAVVLTLFGLLAGVGAAAAVFRYDGSQPIDLLPALAVFAALPLLLLLGFVVSALPLGSIPVLRDLQENLLALAGALASAALRALPADARHALVEAFGEGRAHQRLFGRVQKWILLAEMQRFAVAFHVGAIAWFVVRVFVTDLGFTWSATAEAVTPERLHALVETMALPWSSWLPEAVPSIEDVRSTQFFRLAGGTVGDAATPNADPALLSRWWTFVLATMVTYGLVPRVLTQAIASARHRAAVRWTLTHAPVALDALDRMDAPAVETRATEAEASAPDEAHGVDETPGSHGGHAHAIVWADAATDEAQLRDALRGALDADVADVSGRAGAGTDLAEEESLVRRVADTVAADASVVLVVKAWEPATMDAVDFVRSLRDALGDGRRIVVAARRLDGSDADVDQWRARMKAVGDPWLRTVGFDLSAGGSS